MNKKNWSSSFRLGRQTYGGNQSTYLIAEIGVNHGGSWERAKELVISCAQAGANAVKIQSWSARGLHNVKDVTPDGQVHDSKVLQFLKKYEVPEHWHGELAELCQTQGIDFLSTPFEIGRARLLRSLGVKAIKIASGDLTYDELLEEVGGYGLTIFLSTGMADLGEIERALTLLGNDANRDIILLHCVGAYPPRLEDGNLLAMRTMAEAFDLPVGISDHFPGHDTILAAVALGACVVEKHVTLSRTDGYPDSSYSLEVSEFAAMAAAVRILEAALGDGKKRCMPSEAEGRINGRRSLFAARNLSPGHVITREDIAVVRPNIGILQPQDLRLLLGRRVKSPVVAGAPLRWEHLDLA